MTKYLKQLREHYPFGFALGAAVVAIACFQFVPAWDPYIGTSGYDQFSKTGAAAVAVGVLYFASGGWLLPRTPHQDAAINVRKLAAAVLVAAAVVGLAKVLVQKSDIAPNVSAVLVLVAVFIATAVFEEALFRGLFFEAFVTAASSEKAVLLGAAVSSILFGMLHVSTDIGSLFRIAAYVQATVKVLEGTFFGLAMCALYAKTRSVWPCVLVHLAFDVLSEVPIYVHVGFFTSTYITGSPADIAVLALGSAILAVPAKWALDYLSHQQ